MRTLALSLLATLAFAAPAAAATVADLVVASGTTSVHGNTITGTLVIRNRGSRRAGRSTALLQMGSEGYTAEVIGTAPVSAIKPGKRRTVTVTGGVPTDFKPLLWDMTGCADSEGYVEERSERNNCKKVSDLRISAPKIKAAAKTPAGPVDFTADQPIELQSGASNYWTVVPSRYDDKKPSALLVWLHGCGGNSEGDIYTVAPSDNRNYIAITVGGRDGGCWDTNQDTAVVIAAIADVAKHFNVDTHRVVIGGFSSGGDLAYRTAYDNSTRFAGLLAVGTTPLRDTGSTKADALATPNKFNVVQLAHTDDEFYPIATVRKEAGSLTNAGFPVEVVERAGTHYDAHTDRDLQAVLLPHMTDGWKSP